MNQDRLTVAVFLDRFQQGGYQAPFFISDFRPPDLEQQNDALLITVIPCLMLDGVIKNQYFTFDPVAFLVTESQLAAICRHNQWQVTD